MPRGTTVSLMNFLQMLQAEAEPSGYHKRLRAWVDDKSSVARVLNALDNEEES